MKIPVIAILIEAFALPWRERRAFARALALPLAVIFAFNLACNAYVAFTDAAYLWLYSVAVFSMLGYVVTMTFLAVACHRQVLLRGDVRARWGWRETRYLLWTIGIWALCCALFFCVTWSAMALLPTDLTHKMFADNFSPLQWYLISTLYWLPLSYVFARLCPILPAITVDRKHGCGWAWDLTRGNGWRLALLVGMLPYVLSIATDLLHREDPSLVETVLLTLLSSVLVVVEVTALSLSYKFLAEEGE